MKKIFCDACSYEIKDHPMSFAPLIHVVDHIDGNPSGYVDRDWNPISGRAVHFDLCLSCYNAIHFEAYKVLKVIKETVKAV